MAEFRRKIIDYGVLFAGITIGVLIFSGPRVNAGFERAATAASSHCKRSRSRPADLVGDELHEIFVERVARALAHAGGGGCHAAARGAALGVGPRHLLVQDGPGQAAVRAGRLFYGAVWSVQGTFGHYIERISHFLTLEGGGEGTVRSQHINSTNVHVSILFSVITCLLEQ